MLRVAITGNIASGKSAVEDILKSKMFGVLDTDEVTHNLLGSLKIKKELKKLFKNFDIFENEDVSRVKLGKIVFSDEDMRKKLEELLHPKIRDEINHFFCMQDVQGEKIAFVSVPLLYEAKFERLFDKVVMIYAADDVRLNRLMKRNNLSSEDAQKRLDSQISQDEKTSLADYVLYNDKTLSDLASGVDEILTRLLA